MLKVFAVNSLESVQNSTFSHFPGTFGYVIATSHKPLMNSVCTKLRRKWHKKRRYDSSYFPQATTTQLNKKHFVSHTHQTFQNNLCLLEIQKTWACCCCSMPWKRRRSNNKMSSRHFSWLINQLIGALQKCYWFLNSSLFYPPANLLCQDSQKPAWALHCVWGSRQQARTRSSDKLTLTFERRVNSMMDGWVISMIARPKCLSIKLIKPVNRWLGDGSRTRKRQA